MAKGKSTALIIGAGRGVGRAAALRLAEGNHHVVAVARTKADLEQLRRINPAITIEVADVTIDGVADTLVRTYDPDLIALVGGIRPPIGPISQFGWDDFSAPWASDTKMSFLMAQAILNAPMKRGGTVMAFSSGAALNGSPLSGGYAGAKRMQHFIMNYAQLESDQRDLGLTFTTLYPKQLIAGTEIAGDAASAYGQMKGGDAQMFMNQWKEPLTPDLIAGYVEELAQNPQRGAFILEGTGMVPFV